MNIENLTPKQLRQAADLQENIEKLQHQLADIISVGSIPHTPAKAAQPAKPAKRQMSASARAKIAAAQKNRWAKFHAKTKPPTKAEKPAKKRRKMSAEGRAAIAAAARVRWTKAKAAGKTSL